MFRELFFVQEAPSFTDIMSSELFSLKCLSCLLSLSSATPFWTAERVIREAESYAKLARVEQTNLLIVDYGGILSSHGSFRTGGSMLSPEDERPLLQDMSMTGYLGPWLLDALAAHQRIVLLSE